MRTKSEFQAICQKRIREVFIGSDPGSLGTHMISRSDEATRNKDMGVSCVHVVVPQGRFAFGEKVENLAKKLRGSVSNEEFDKKLSEKMDEAALDEALFQLNCYMKDRVIATIWPINGESDDPMSPITYQKISFAEYGALVSANRKKADDLFRSQPKSERPSPDKEGAIAQKADNQGSARLAWEIDPDVLLQFLCAKNDYTLEHCYRVSHYASELYLLVDEKIRLGLSQSFRQMLELAGLLHDLGKMMVPDSLLDSKEKLLCDRLYWVNRHANVGLALVGVSLPQSHTDLLLLPILCHHLSVASCYRFIDEWYSNLVIGAAIREEQIGPVMREHKREARMAVSFLKLADSLDAMTSRRRYNEKSLKTICEACDILCGDLGQKKYPAAEAKLGRTSIHRNVPVLDPSSDEGDRQVADALGTVLKSVETRRKLDAIRKSIPVPLGAPIQPAS